MLFRSIIDGNLPLGNDWLDHLDILKAVRINQFSSVGKINDIYIPKLSGYVDVGIEKESETYIKAIQILTEVNLPSDILLIEHTLNSKYVRIPVVNRDSIENSCLYFRPSNTQSSVKIEFSKEQKDALYRIYDLYEKNDSLQERNKHEFMNEWNKYDNLRKLREWWDSDKVGFSITSAGKVLAHANAQRCDKTLPPLV